VASYKSQRWEERHLIRLLHKIWCPSMCKQACTIGYNLSTYSSIKILSIDAGSYHDLAGFCVRMARNNHNDVVSRSQTPSLYQDLLLLESLVLISIFLPTLNYRLRTMT
jgi:hypothetical protein